MTVSESTRMCLRGVRDLDAVLGTSTIRSASSVEEAAWRSAEAPYLRQASIGAGAVAKIPKDTPDAVLVDELRARLDGFVGVLKWISGTRRELVYFERDVFLENVSAILSTQARVCGVRADGSASVVFDHDLFLGTWFYLTTRPPDPD